MDTTRLTPLNSRSKNRHKIKDSESELDDHECAQYCVCIRNRTCHKIYGTTHYYDRRKDKKPKENEGQQRNKNGAERRVALAKIISSYHAARCDEEYKVCHHFLHYHPADATLQHVSVNDPDGIENMSDDEITVDSNAFNDEYNLEPIVRDIAVLNSDITMAEFERDEHKVLTQQHVSKGIGRKVHRHSHICTCCRNIYTHTHNFKTASEQSKYPSECNDCLKKKRNVSTTQPAESLVQENTEPPATAESIPRLTNQRTDHLETYLPIAVRYLQTEVPSMRLTVCGPKLDGWDQLTGYVRNIYQNTAQNQMDKFKAVEYSCISLLNKCNLEVHEANVQRFHELNRRLLVIRPDMPGFFDLTKAQFIDQNWNNTKYWAGVVAGFKMVRLFTPTARPIVVSKRGSVRVTHMSDVCHAGAHGLNEYVRNGRFISLKQCKDDEIMPHTLKWAKLWDHENTECPAKLHLVGISLGYYNLPRNCCLTTAAGFMGRQALPHRIDSLNRANMYRYAFQALQIVANASNVYEGWYMPADRAQCIADWVNKAHAAGDRTKALRYQRLADDATLHFDWQQFTTRCGGESARCILTDYMYKFEPVKTGVVVNRVISNVDPRLLGQFGPHFDCYISQYKRVWANCVFRYTSGLDATAVGELFGMMVERGMKIVAADMSRCDGHMTPEAFEAYADHLRWCGMEEHVSEYVRVTARCTKGSYRGISRSAGKRESVKVWTGVTLGGMPSGISFTSLGTSEILMSVYALYMAVEYYIRHCDLFRGERPTNEDELTTLIHTIFEAMHTGTVPDGFRRNLETFIRAHCLLIQLGDDSVFGTTFDADKRMIETLFTIVGHDADVVNHGTNYDAVDFCSMWFWNYAPGKYVLGPKIFRSLAKSFMHPTEKFVDPYIRKIDQDNVEAIAQSTQFACDSYIYTVAVGMRGYTFLPVLGRVLEQIITRSSVAKFSHSPYLMPDNPHKIFLHGVITNYDANLLERQFQAIYGYTSDAFAQLLEHEWYTAGQFIYPDHVFDHCANVDGIIGKNRYDGPLTQYYNGTTRIFRTCGSAPKDPNVIKRLTQPLRAVAFDVLRAAAGWVY